MLFTMFSDMWPLKTKPNQRGRYDAAWTEMRGGSTDLSERGRPRCRRTRAAEAEHHSGAVEADPPTAKNNRIQQLLGSWLGDCFDVYAYAYEGQHAHDG